MKSIFKFFVFALVAAIAGALVTMTFHSFLPSADRAKDVSYSDFLSISLTALSLMITVLGIFFAAAGVIGWATLENKLREHSISYFKEELGKDGKLRAELEELLSDMAYEGIENYKAQKGMKDEAEYND